jgi:hypothetical protein
MKPVTFVADAIDGKGALVVDNGTLIRQAWTVTWRHHFLWVLGILAGGAVGVPTFSGGGGNGGSTRAVDIANLHPSLAGIGKGLELWAAQNAGLLIGLSVLAVVLAFVLVVLSLIAQGAMAEATTGIVTGRGSSLGRAWSAGVHLFWRYVGLWLVLLVAIVGIAGALIAAAAVMVYMGDAPAVGLALGGLMAAAVIVGFVTFVLRLIHDSGVPRWLMALAAALFALPIFTVLVAAALVLSIVTAFAQRAIVAENAGPIDALRVGWRLTREHFGESLLTWLVNLGIAVAGGIALLLGVLGALLLLGGIGAAVFALAGLSAPTLVYIGAGGLAFLVGVLAIAGIANTFFWTYWTLAYLRLSGRPVQAV